VRTANDGKLNVCNLGGIVPNVKIVGGLSPQIDSSLNVIGVDALVNAALDLTFEGLETLVANAILDVTDWLIEVYGSAYGNIRCLS
jgi:hypothetical protein